MRKNLAIITAVFALALATLACGSSGEATSLPIVRTATPEAGAAQVTNPPQNTETSAATVAPTTTAAPKETSLGDVVTEGDYFVQAIAVEDPAKPGLLYQAETGKKLVAVQIIVGNNGKASVSVNPLNTALVDNEGYTYEPDLGGRDGQIASLDLFQGERVKGWISFKIPDNATAKALKFDSSFFGLNTLIVGLTTSGGEAKIAPLPERVVPTLPKLGDTVEQDGYSLTATAVQDPAKPSALYSRQKGMRLIAVEIVISNLSGAKLSVNALNATLRDTYGFVYNVELGAANSQIDTVDIDRGQKAKGLVAFAIPDDAKPEAITYNTGAFGTGTVLTTGLNK